MMPESKRSPRILRVLRTGTLTLVLGACTHPTSIPSGLDEVLSLSEGDSVRVSGAVVVHALALQDSRCPSDVVCIAAGDVVIVLGLNDGGTVRTDTLRLTSAPRATSFGGLLFQPTDVKPYPNTNAAPSLKTLTLRVTAAP